MYPNDFTQLLIVEAENFIINAQPKACCIYKMCMFQIMYVMSYVKCMSHAMYITLSYVKCVFHAISMCHVLSIIYGTQAYYITGWRRFIGFVML